MPEWNSPIECPKCVSRDTRFVEPRYKEDSNSRQSLPDMDYLKLLAK